MYYPDASLLSGKNAFGMVTFKTQNSLIGRETKIKGSLWLLSSCVVYWKCKKGSELKYLMLSYCLFIFTPKKNILKAFKYRPEISILSLSYRILY